MTYPTYRCYNCGTMISMQPCFQCENMKNLRRAADAQEEANRRAERESRARERERERSQFEAEREAYYERQRRRQAELEADPEYQERLARRREEEYREKFDQELAKAMAEGKELIRWESLSPQQQASETELKNLRVRVANARQALINKTGHSPTVSPTRVGTLDPEAVIGEIANIKAELLAITQEDLRWEELKAQRAAQREKEQSEFRAKVAFAAMVGFASIMFITNIDINWFPEERATRTEYADRYTPSPAPVIPITSTPSARSEKISSIIQAEVEERCPKSRGYTAGTNDRGEIVVNVVCPQFDSRGKIVSTKQITWTSEASLLFKN